MREPTVVVVGGVATDLVARVDALPSGGEGVAARRFVEDIGGKAAVQALACARLGADVSLVGVVGDDDRGRAISTRMRDSGVHVDGLRSLRGVPTGAVLIVVDGDGQTRTAAYDGASLCLTEDDVGRHMERPFDAVLASLGGGVEAARAALERGRQRGTLTVLDPAPGTPVDDDLLALVDVVRPNHREAELLTGVHVTGAETAQIAAVGLCRRGARAAVVDALDDGNVLVDGRGAVTVPRLPVDVVDGKGAGDALVAALTVELARGRPLREAARFASAAAALATTQLGAAAGAPTRDAVLRLLPKA